MRKLFILLAASILCAACGSKTTEQNESDAATALTEQAPSLVNQNVRIGSLYYNLYDDLTAEVQRSDSYKNFSDALTIPETVDYDSQTYRVTSIGDFAFSGCTGLTSPVYNEHVFAYLPPSYRGAYAIPKGISQIGDRAFLGCTGLTSVTIPNSVTSIGDRAFEGCTNLQITYEE